MLRTVSKLEKPKTQRHEVAGKVIEIQYGDLRVGYMCKVAFDHELGNAPKNKIYSSVESLKKDHPFEECGIVEVEVRLRQVIEETDFSESIKKALKRKKKNDHDTT